MTTHKDKLINENVVVGAILFHDVIYEPKRKDNELRSVDIFLVIYIYISLLYKIYYVAICI